MADLEVLRSYLVSLGFQTDQSSLRRFDSALKDAAGMVSFRTGGILGQMLKWQGAITGAFVAVSTGVIAMADHVADADQKYRLFGLRMFMTTEQARKLQIGTDALGASLEEIAADPELNARFLQLSELQDKLAKGLGSNFKDDMRAIRDLRFEFTKLQVTIQYLSFKFVSTLFEKMGFTAETAGKKIEEFTNWLAAHLPEAADWLANHFVPILKTTWEILKDLGRAFLSLATAFTNLMAALSGDDALTSTEFSFDKFGKAVLGAADFLADFANYVSSAVEEVAHLISAVSLLFRMRWKEAGSEFAKALAPAPTPVAERRRLEQDSSAENSSPRSGEPAAESFASRPPSASPASPAAAAVPTSSVAEQARALALRVGAELRINPRLVFEQWQHETGGFRNRGARELNNLGGVRIPGTTVYRQFNTLDEYGNYYVQMLRRPRYAKQGILQARNEEEFAGALKRGGYFEGGYQDYVNGMKRFGRGWSDDWLRGGTRAPETPEQTVTIGDVHIQITQTNPSPQETAQAVERGLTQAAARRAKQRQRTMAQLGFAGG